MSDNITTGVAGAFIPEVWSRTVKRAAENKLVMADLVKRFDTDAGKGDTIHVPNLSNITATYKVANTEVPATATTESENTISLDKHAVARVNIDKMTDVQADYNLFREYTDKLGYSIGLLVDDDVIGLYSGLSQTVGATDSNVGIAKTYIQGAIRQLDSANAPQEDRHLVVDAYGREDLFGIEDFVRYDAAGQGGDKNAIINGNIGRLYGVNVHYSENVSTDGSMIYAPLFQKEAFALAMQRNFEVDSDFDVPELATVVVASAIYGVAEYRDTYGTVVHYGNA